MILLYFIYGLWVVGATHGLFNIAGHVKPPFALVSKSSTALQNDLTRMDRSGASLAKSSYRVNFAFLGTISKVGAVSSWSTIVQPLLRNLSTNAPNRYECEAQSNSR
jgi:hypothetical protein